MTREMPVFVMCLNKKRKTRINKSCLKPQQAAGLCKAFSSPISHHAFHLCGNIWNIIFLICLFTLLPGNTNHIFWLPWTTAGQSKSFTHQLPEFAWEWSPEVGLALKAAWRQSKRSPDKAKEVLSGNPVSSVGLKLRDAQDGANPGLAPAYIQ